MLIYWSVCLLSVLFAWFGNKIKHKKTDSIYYWKLAFFSALPMIFVASVRYNVGKDYFYTYVPYFQNLKYGISDLRLEPLYHLINVIVIKLNGDYPWVFAISAIIFLGNVFYRIFRDSPKIYLSIFLLVGTTYYFIFFNTMRQLIGCSVLLLSLKYARERNFVKFLLVVAVATCFHSSCAVFVLFYFISNVKISPKAVFMIIVCVAVFGRILGNILVNIIMSTKYAIYIGSRFDTSEQGYIVLLMNIAILMFATIFYSDDKKYRQYYNLQFIAVCIALLNGEVALISRTRWMFGLPVIILIPLTINNIKDAKSRGLAEMAIIGLYFIYASYTIGVKNGNSVIPYQTIFSVM
ncbi:MAG: EpsG family protein [Ruminococcus flavefaciens]|nr:EpsG family protein [Ruminococcus flavefaciens]